VCVCVCEDLNTAASGRAAGPSATPDSNVSAAGGHVGRLGSSSRRSHYFNTLSATTATTAAAAAAESDVTSRDVIVHQHHGGVSWSRDEDSDVIAGTGQSPSQQSVTYRTSLSVCLSVRPSVRPSVCPSLSVLVVFLLYLLHTRNGTGSELLNRDSNRSRGR